MTAAPTTLTSRKFNQYPGMAKKAAASGPVIITYRGKPSHVLLSFDAYERLSFGTQNIIDMLAMPGATEIDFQPPRAAIVSTPADLS